MGKIRELGKRARRVASIAQHDGTEFAVTGKLYSDGTVALRGRVADDDVLPLNYAYVRVNGKTENTRIVVNGTIDSSNVPVRIKKNEKNEYEIYRPDMTGGGAATTERLLNAQIPYLNGAIRGDLWYRQNLAIWRVRISDLGGLYITVDVNFYTDGSRFRIFPKTDLDISVSQPTSGKCWVVVSVDLRTGTLLQAAGTAVSLASPLPYTEIESVNFSGYPLVALPLTDSQTSITTRNDWFDLQPFGAGSSEPSLDQIITDANASIVVDANGNVVYGD